MSNASVGATAMALTPVFVAFTEPLLIGRRFRTAELALAVAAIPGIILVVGGTPDRMQAGIVVGVIAAAIAAVFAALNKRYVEQGHALTVTGLEMGAGVGCLTLLSLSGLSPDSVFVIPPARDAVYLLILGIGCTLIPYALVLVALRRVSAFSAVLAVNLEPVYAVLLAIVILGEQQELSGQFYLGVAVIIVVVFSHPLLARRFSGLR